MPVPGRGSGVVTVAMIAASLVACGVSPSVPRSKEPALRVEPPEIVLGSRLSRQHLLVTEALGAQEVDRTGEARIAADDEAVVAIRKGAVLEPIGNGKTTITVRVGDRSARVPVTVRLAEREEPPAFRTQIEPVLSKAGCNVGSCHGAFAGKGGLRLSLFNSEIYRDYAALTDPASRRIDRARPEESVLLRKVLGDAGHAGGARLARDSLGYQTLLGWVRAGAPLEPATETGIDHIEVAPVERVLAPIESDTSPDARARSSTHLLVTAVFADGRRADVTSTALYTSKDPGVAEVDEEGVITARRPGETAIVVGYLGHFGASHVLAPLPGKPVQQPPPRIRNLVDEHVFSRLQKLNVTPAAPCDDATFLRRVMVDVIGVLPSASEARAFEIDARPDKRERLVETLLARPQYAKWWATLLSDLTGNDSRYLGTYSWKYAYAWWSWLRARIDRGQPWDAMVRDILLATSREGRSYEELVHERAEEMREVEDIRGWNLKYDQRKTLDLFWNKISNRAPDVVAQEISYSFLGVRIDCAQCHKHPFAQWTQDDFWRFAAFFSRVKIGYPADVRTRFPDTRPPFKEIFLAGAGDPWTPLKDPRTGQPLTPKLLDGATVPDDRSGDPREPLARWLTAPGNPYFARAIVNRIFAHYFGRGLIEPTDAISAANPPSDPQLLDALTRDFTSHGFDLRRLHRLLVGSSAYQLSARPSRGDRDPNSRAHYQTRRLPAETMIEAIQRVTGHPGVRFDRFTPPETGPIEYPMSRPIGAMAYPFAVFGKPTRATISDCERDDDPSLSQAIYLLNDHELMGQIRSPEGWLAASISAGLGDEAILEQLMYTALGRPPRPAERERLLATLRKWQDTGDGRASDLARREALEDLMATLLQLDEFQTNH